MKPAAGQYVPFLGPIGWTVQGGYSWGQGANDPRRGPFLEGGSGFGTLGVAGTVFYSWKIGNICH